VPLDVVDQESDDPVVKREAEVHERALLCGAATRAKKDVLTFWCPRLASPAGFCKTP
jgi:hypothetical protein